MKKLISVLLLVAMLLTTACSDNTDVKETTADTTVPVAETAAETDAIDARKAIPDDLPQKDMDGYLMKIYSLEGFDEWFYSKEETGEPVQDAFYRTRRGINERFNADMSITLSGLDPWQHVPSISSLVQSGDTNYTLACGHTALIGELTLNNQFLNIRDLPYLNFDKPWWIGVDDYTYLGQCYFIPSDISILSLIECTALYVNKNKLEDYGIEIPYKTVLEGKWTLDKLIEMTKDVYEDLNMNNTVDKDDFYGLLAPEGTLFWEENFGVDFLSKDGDDLVVDIDVDKMSSIAEKVLDYIRNSKGTPEVSNLRVLGNAEFANGQALFLNARLEDAALDMRYIESFEYGILPMPKYDELQEDYRSPTQSSPFCVMTTLPAEFYDNTGILIEAFSAAGYKEVVPTYFELALKTKYTTDDESAQMLDIIAENRYSNFAFAYASTSPYCFLLTNLLNNNTAEFTSYYERNYNSALKQVEKIQKAFEDMAG